MSQAPVRRRPKIAATVDPELLAAVDAFIADHPGSDRSKVIDDALRLWREREIERAMEEQFAARDVVDPAERAAWKALQRAATVKWLSTRREA
jgi:metal-responsive CopG/Arc/MetJ family transcriptional regulator